jgi:DNA repair protein RadD
MVELRQYQEDAIEAVFKYWREEGGNPLIELATGLGKSLVVAEVARRLLRDFPSMRIIMVVHVRELVQQNFQELLRLWPDAPVGIYSAGLGQRDPPRRDRPELTGGGVAALDEVRRARSLELTCSTSAGPNSS